MNTIKMIYDADGNLTACEIEVMPNRLPGIEIGKFTLKPMDGHADTYTFQRASAAMGLLLGHEADK